MKIIFDLLGIITSEKLFASRIRSKNMETWYIYKSDLSREPFNKIIRKVNNYLKAGQNVNNGPAGIVNIIPPGPNGPSGKPNVPLGI